MKATPVQRHTPEPDDTTPQERARASLVLIVAMIGFVVGVQIESEGALIPYKLFGRLTVPIVVTAYYVLRYVRLPFALFPLALGTWMLGAAYLTASYAPQWLTVLGHIMLLVPAVALAFAPPDRNRTNWKRLLLPATVAILLVWLLTDWPGVLYVMSLIFVPVAIRSGVRALAARRPRPWTLALRRAVTGG